MYAGLDCGDYMFVTEPALERETACKGDDGKRKRWETGHAKGRHNK